MAIGGIGGLTFRCHGGNIPLVITGPPNGPVLFCSLASVGVCRLLSVVVCNTANRRAGRPAAGRAGGRAANTGGRASRVTSR